MFLCKDGMRFHKCSLLLYSKDRLCPRKKKKEKGGKKKQKTGLAKTFQSLTDLIRTSLAATRI